MYILEEYISCLCLC